MLKQNPKERIRNFDEVALGLSVEEAVAEAKRCLLCKKPSCVGGCPVEIDIPSFIKLAAQKDFGAAISKIKEKNNLPAVCGRVCPQEDQCQLRCILNKKNIPIQIGAIERFAADWEIDNKTKNQIPNTKNEDQIPKTKNKEKKSDAKKIAVIGSGPAGLTCAADLARMGYTVTLFESLHKAGGVLVYGIPEFRLPKHIVDYEVEYIKNLGVELKPNFLIGRTETMEGLRQEGYKSFFIATGAGLPYFLGIDGENLNGIYSANEFLTRVNLMKAYRFPEYETPVSVGSSVAVIGAGNVAMDCARCARRMGAKEVSIVYRRTETEMPARKEEIENAKEEGIELKLLTNPVRIFGENGWVKSMECVKNELGAPDESGRRRPVAIKGSEYVMGVDTIICAIGQGPNPLLLDRIDGLKLNKNGNIIADEGGRTNFEDIFAGGDIVTGAATVILAMGAGKKAAREIDGYLKNGHP
ncbi:MAG: NADPH-dependent glutamate synthase [Candidatus Omnitrophica bacterium]|nr:NADPH-dependent glutamate synthase [Candidatus Omnitrophota bacterium]